MPSLEAELDMVVGMMPAKNLIVSGGFTLDDLTNRMGVSNSCARDRLYHLIRCGKVRMVGYRPGRNGAKVYEVVAGE